jgi:hypothetical protein
MINLCYTRLFQGVDNELLNVLNNTIYYKTFNYNCETNVFLKQFFVNIVIEQALSTSNISEIVT